MPESSPPVCSGSSLSPVGFFRRRAHTRVVQRNVKRAAALTEKGASKEGGPRFEKEVFSGVAVDTQGSRVDSWVFRRAPLAAVSGHPARVVVIHGLGDAPVTWFPALRHALASCELVLPALPGAGRGPLPQDRGPLDFRETVSWVQQLLGRIVDQEGGPVTVVGHSLGGWLVARALLQDPSLAGALQPPVFVNNAGTWYEGVQRERELLSPRRVEDVEELLEQMYASVPLMPIEALQSLLETMQSPAYRRLLESTVRADFLSPEEIGRLPAGSGLVWGLADGLVPQQAFETLRDHLEDPRVVELAFCGHAPHLEAPRKIMEVLARLV